MPFVSHAYTEHLNPDERRRFVREHITLGYHPTSRDDLMLPDIDRYSGMTITGIQGSGKSGLLKNMVHDDAMKGNAVVFLDPHMDAVMDCIATLPQSRLKHTYLLDMEDEAYPFGVNIFAAGELTTSIDHTQAVDRILHVFEVLWPDVLSQQHLPRYLRMATIVFLANPGKTLVDMYAFLLDDATRRQMLAAVTDPTVKQFWQLQYDNLKPDARISRVQPLLGRLEQLFAGRSLVRNIVGQPHSSIDFRRAIERKEIIFIKLPLKTVPQDARLIGTLLVAQIHAALFSFADLPADKRPGVSLYIDEFQNFSTPDIEELFTEGRKFGMRIVVANQFRSQLSEKLREAAMTARTKVCFRLTPEDSSKMAHEFPSPEVGVKPENIDPHATETLANHPHLHPPVVQEFIETYLLPVRLQQVGSHGNKVKIRDTGFSALDLTSALVSGGNMHYEPEIESPTDYLDYLLQQVMVTGAHATAIPSGAVRGFANCGISFWQKVRGMGDGDRRLVADIPNLNIPAHLALRTGDGSYRWTRAPEDGTEQLYHFLFHLRMTMRYLAEHPLGKQSAVSTAEVGKMLNQLPKRAAFARAGDTVGVIYTHDTPPRTVDAEFEKRVTAVQAQTRQAYCHPRAEVEKSILHSNDATTPSMTHSNAPSNNIAVAPPVPPTAPAQPVPLAPMAPADDIAQPPLSGWEEAEP